MVYSSHLVCHEVCRVETHTELTDHRDVSAGLERLHEGLRAGLGDRAEVVDEVGLGHADAAVDEGQRLGLLVGLDLDEEVLLGVQLARVGQRLVADLVEGVAAVGDQLPEEDLLVGVEGVDDERHELRDLGLEGEGLHVAVGSHLCVGGGVRRVGAA